jgi:hypothetical protein
VLNVPAAKYPCVYPDHRAMFRVIAPDAKTVSVRIGGGFDMTKGPDGIWSVTTTPLVVGFHYYSLRVDGATVADPSTMTSFGSGWLNSGIEIPEPDADADYYQAKDVPHRHVADGRPFPQDPNPSWTGYSTAHWEGDTLVVQTAGFRNDLWADMSGSPLSEAARLTERIRRPNFGTLELEVTVDDPKVYTKPWTAKLTQKLELDTELIDEICLEPPKDRARFADVRNLCADCSARI